jgi:hypothetical protein
VRRGRGTARLRCSDCGRHVSRGPLELVREDRGFVWKCDSREACLARRSQLSIFEAAA